MISLPPFELWGHYLYHKNLECWLSQFYYVLCQNVKFSSSACKQHDILRMSREQPQWPETVFIWHCSFLHAPTPPFPSLISQLSVCFHCHNTETLRKRKKSKRNKAESVKRPENLIRVLKSYIMVSVIKHPHIALMLQVQRVCWADSLLEYNMQCHNQTPLL